jgi:hypothetical protein
MKRHAIRRNPTTGNWIMYWYNPYKKTYQIKGRSSSWRTAMKAL